MFLGAGYDHLYAGTEQAFTNTGSVLANTHQLVTTSHCAKASQWEKLPLQVQIYHVIVKSNKSN